jgi:hypothetical protein
MQFYTVALILANNTYATMANIEGNSRKVESVNILSGDGHNKPKHFKIIHKIYIQTVVVEPIINPWSTFFF